MSDTEILLHVTRGDAQEVWACVAGGMSARIDNNSTLPAWSAYADRVRARGAGFYKGTVTTAGGHVVVAGLNRLSTAPEMRRLAKRLHDSTYPPASDSQFLVWLGMRTRAEAKLYREEA